MNQAAEVIDLQRTKSDPSPGPVLQRACSDLLRTSFSTSATSFTEVSDAALLQLRNAPYAKDLRAAFDAVRLASKLSKAIQNQLSNSEKVEKKDESPVTVADFGAQALVAWSLTKLDPTTRLSMVAEEDSKFLRTPEGAPLLERITDLVNETLTELEGTGNLSQEDVLMLIDLGDSNGGPTGRHWVLDPIDGTKGFVGMRQYAVCLGLIEDGEPVLGVLGCPNMPLDQVTHIDGGPEAMARAQQDSSIGSMFFAHKGYGAYVAPLWEAYDIELIPHIHRIQVNDVPAPFTSARFMEAYDAKHSNHSITAELAESVGVTLPPFRMDSQVKYGVLSRGDASVFMRFPGPHYREKIWDHAAGFVIVEESGGKVTDAKGRRLDFSKGRELETEGGIISGPPALHAALIEAVAKLELVENAGA